MCSGYVYVKCDYAEENKYINESTKVIIRNK